MMMKSETRLKLRHLLAASAGLAALSLTATGQETEPPAEPTPVASEEAELSISRAEKLEALRAAAEARKAASAELLRVEKLETAEAQERAAEAQERAAETEEALQAVKTLRVALERVVDEDGVSIACAETTELTENRECEDLAHQTQRTDHE